MKIMKVSPHFQFCSSLLLITALRAISDPAGDTDLVAELRSLQSRSEHGVIHINDKSFHKFLTSSKPPRPYHLLIFFDAVDRRENSDLRLHHFLSEFNLLASSFIANNDRGSNLFFCYVELGESKTSFAQFGVDSLPNIRIVNPNTAVLSESGKIGRRESESAEMMAEFVRTATGFAAGTIHRPPVLSRGQVLLLAGVVSAWTPLITVALLRVPETWLAGAVFIYFFSVSGGMCNIIRKTAMFTEERGRAVYFRRGAGEQLGAEGFAVGFLYTIVGVMIALVTHLVVRVRNVNVQRAVMVFVLLVCFWAVKMVVDLDNWKTGYAIHGFWPSSWN